MCRQIAIIDSANERRSRINGWFLKVWKAVPSNLARMKKNVLMGLAVIGMATAFTAPARAGVSLDIRIGLPLPPMPAIVVAPPRVVIPPPPVVVVRPPVPICPPPAIVSYSVPVAVACPPPVVVAYPPPVVVGHPRFIPPGHAKRYGYAHHSHGRYDRHDHGRGHGHRH